LYESTTLGKFSKVIGYKLSLSFLKSNIFGFGVVVDSVASFSVLAPPHSHPAAALGCISRVLGVMLVLFERWLIDPIKRKRETTAMSINQLLKVRVQVNLVRSLDEHV